MRKRVLYYREALLQEIRQFLEQGIDVVIDGEDYDEAESPIEIDMVLENTGYTTYMKNYTGNQDGKIIAVEFNKVKETGK
ncbi:MAG: hypothetical protein J6B85_01745 [Lachnospiraceae bacterium]|nr:hypothetical protein [Lachnospiraceae bacterium]